MSKKSSQRNKAARKHKSSRTGGSSSQPTPRRAAAPMDLNPLAADAVARSLKRFFGDRKFVGDREAIAALQQRLKSSIPGDDEPGSDLDAAQTLVVEGYNHKGVARIEFFIRALAYTAECSDAWLGLATNIPMPDEETIRMLERAIVTGERALPADIEQRPELYWTDVDTRPYMRARVALALTLLATDQHDEALEHFQGLMTLDPIDHMGCRTQVLPLLIERGMLDDAATLLRQFPSEWSTQWMFDRALVGIVREQLDATQLLDEAIYANEFVVPYLIGTHPPPRNVNAIYPRGSREEAAMYVKQHAQLWQANERAVAVLIATQRRREQSS